jgi:hypothetical protein
MGARAIDRTGNNQVTSLQTLSGFSAPSVADETRPTNRTIRVWVRTA